jgi:outer membrane protein OmpA-like peptidoglycan-associated protein
MRTVSLVTLAILFTAVSTTACGNGSAGNKSASKPSAPATATDQAQKVSLTTESKPVTSDLATSIGPDGKPARFTLVLSESKGGFKFNTVTLSDDAKALIDEMFTSGKVDLKGAHFEIEGYTDNVGSKVVNEKIGLRRADAVRQYIAEKYEVPMECITVTSYGLENPIADNSTEEGRAQNRRVVIKVVD